MPRYRFIEDFERVLTGLAHGVNATVHRANPDAPEDVEGSTVIAQPTDEITTTEAYPHPFMQEVDADAKPAKKLAPAKKPAKKAVAVDASPLPAAAELAPPAQPATPPTTDGQE